LFPCHATPTPTTSFTPDPAPTCMQGSVSGTLTRAAASRHSSIGAHDSASGPSPLDLGSGRRREGGGRSAERAHRAAWAVRLGCPRGVGVSRRSPWDGGLKAGFVCGGARPGGHAISAGSKGGTGGAGKLGHCHRSRGARPYRFAGCPPPHTAAGAGRPAPTALRPGPGPVSARGRGARWGPGARAGARCGFSAACGAACGRRERPAAAHITAAPDIPGPAAATRPVPNRARRASPGRASNRCWTPHKKGRPLTPARGSPAPPCTSPTLPPQRARRAGRRPPR
jgi:hypothetical protein